GPLVLGVCRQVLRNDHDAEDAFQATFLVLARKAASIHSGEALAAWLHRVAFNLAHTARSGAAQRRARERQALRMPEADPVQEANLRDLQPLLHEEVNRLPWKYRVAVVLCYLQGKTNEEAARELHWPVGSVKGRLTRAREMLRARLERRGLALPAGGLAALLAAGASQAAVPATLAGSTPRAALLSAAGQTAKPPAAVPLATPALRAAPPRLLLAIVLSITATAAGLFAFHARPEPPLDVPPASVAREDHQE